MTEQELRQALHAAMDDYKQTPAYQRNFFEEFRNVGLRDMATDLAPLVWKRLPFINAE